MKYVNRQKLSYIEYFVRGLYNIPQRINFTFNNYSKHNYDIVGDVVVQGVTPITFGTPTARPSL